MNQDKDLVQITIPGIPPEVVRQIDELARLGRRSRSFIVRELLAQSVQKSQEVKKVLQAA